MDRLTLPQSGERWYGAVARMRRNPGVHGVPRQPSGSCRRAETSRKRVANEATMADAAESLRPYSFGHATQSGFAPISSRGPFGPITDIAAGWDGSLWGIDTFGTPQSYDPLNGRWQVFGS